MGKDDLKAPPNGFMMFAQSIRAATKAEFPEKSMVELGKLSGERWRDLSAEKKEEWVSKAKAARAEFEKEHGPIVRKPKAKAAKGKAEPKAGAVKAAKADGPKKSKGAFMFFCDGNRAAIKAANPDAKFTDLGKLLGAAWKELDAAGKKEYEDLAAKDKARYEAEKGK